MKPPKLCNMEITQCRHRYQNPCIKTTRFLIHIILFKYPLFHQYFSQILCNVKFPEYMRHWIVDQFVIFTQTLNITSSKYAHCFAVFCITFIKSINRKKKRINFTSRTACIILLQVFTSQSWDTRLLSQDNHIFVLLIFTSSSPLY